MLGDLLATIIAFIIGSVPFPETATPATMQDTASRTTREVSLCPNHDRIREGISPEYVRVPQALTGIKKPTRANTVSGYEIDRCQNTGSCSGPDIANYRLIAANIRVDKTVFPNSFIDGILTSDRQLVKQTDFSDDPTLSDRYKNRIYRTHCGDWCYTCEPEDVKCLDKDCLKVECNTDKPAVELPFRGSFHCDFVYYLQDTDAFGKEQIDPSGNVPPEAQSSADSAIPQDGRLFSIYMREDAPIPKYAECTDSDPASQEAFITPSYLPPSQDTNILSVPQFPQSHYRRVSNPETANGSFIARNSQILATATRIATVTNPVGLTGTFEVYANLFDPDGDYYLYLTAPGIVDAAPSTFSYYLLRNDAYLQPSDKSLKLATFPFSNDWIKKWVQESKPAIYIYPQKETDVTVTLNPLGYLTVSDPPYDTKTGWHVRAYPDGKLIQRPKTRGQRPYPYLFYEAMLSEMPNPTEGFVVPKTNLTDFLKWSLGIAGLTPSETQDYLSYWLPRLETQPGSHILVSFLSEKEIEHLEPMTISIPVDSTIRIRTYFLPLDGPLDIPNQVIPRPVERSGTTVVEWGGILDSQ